MNRSTKKVTASSRGRNAAKAQKTNGTAAGRRLVESAGRVIFPKPPPIDVAAVRAKTGLSQNEFARRFMLPPGTLRNWEQGLRQPEGAARLLLALIDRAPEVVSGVADDLARIPSA